jgi:multidrug resistance efflux pump
MNTLKINDVISDNNNDITDLKNKNKEYEEQINKMKAEIEELNKKVNGGGLNLDPKKFEELRHQNLLYYNKLQEAQKKIAQANSLVGKAKKYNLCAAYISQLLGMVKPENDKQSYLFIKLKSLIEDYEKEKSNKK